MNDTDCSTTIEVQPQDSGKHRQARFQGLHDAYGMLSHELRTPLNAVIGYAQLLQIQPGASPETIHRYAKQILDAGHHMLSLIDQTLSLQQIEAGCLSLEIDSLDLFSCVQSAQTLLLPAAMAQGIHISNQIPTHLLVRADALRLRQILLNIGSNAIKYNVPQGRVDWHADVQPSGRIRLSVHDTGRGMTAQQTAHLFEPFQRLGQERSAIAGSGLGLLIARRLVEEMKGTLNVRSEPDVGTTVEIELQAGV